MSGEAQLVPGAKLKVVTFVGTRPEIIRLSRIIPLLDVHCDHVLAHTGQNYDYELNEIFFTDLAIRRPDRFLEAAGASSAETIGNVIAGADKLLREEMPDAVLILGDTNSCLAAIAAKRLKIPVFHMEAGNRCFDQRVPEEINRKIVDHISDINLTYSAIARENLLREGLPTDMVIKTGSPMMEVLHHYRDGIASSGILDTLELTRNQYFVVSTHREENVDSRNNLFKIVAILNDLAENYGFPIILSTHPRTQKRIDEWEVRFHPLVRVAKPFGFTDYIALQRSAFAVLSDSGTITEEASILNFPALNLRETHERHEGMEEASVMMVGLNAARVRQALGVLATQARDENRTLRLPADYDAPNVSQKVLRIILSYVDYVKSVTWRESTTRPS
ncbi:non-hydrolyzing UDP-N-acetylglucosamine 2-epimerase [Sphingomonas yabuuchiae]|uniref:UDP-N-acetylglucosamine 2-epimerase (Non-hydrolyzing) n=1 Tax=Sphingomonas yabuuchiae TaxID=172044 RepID=A0AA41DA66_9SPHN|nr:UDP-N-acetylglucosamine 2-epimerase (non-hydrolyzing) [Sphingomonas yabuuchiae]MBB4611407.1 UDP-N-acetylglucosamine 2-epimerase (non-hydrolyzing) [Sphingomonas yabuuchiae]MBN3556993.1 UDP-N-acetylglucosamine 2-epimerase (non-hydrolyzing) [Sphingomonas yabuuchiae]